MIKKSKPKISVLMPVYNVAPFVAESVRSILDQTFSDFELIIIDDGSTDATVEVIKKFADPRIRLIKHKENKGIVAALNRGLAESRAGYLARQDGDDRSRPDRLRRLFNYLERHPDIGVVSSALVAIDKQSGHQEVWCSPLNDREIRLRMLAVSSIHHAAAMMRRELLEEVGGYRADYEDAEDYDLWLRLARITSFANLPEVLYEMRSHPHSVSRRNRSRQNASRRVLRLLAWEIQGSVFWDYGIRDIVSAWLQYRPWRGCAGRRLLIHHKTFLELCLAFYEDGRQREMIWASLITIALNPFSWQGWITLGLVFYMFVPPQLKYLDDCYQRRRYGEKIEKDQ